jgi:hypothetical protein
LEIFRDSLPSGDKDSPTNEEQEGAPDFGGAADFGSKRKTEIFIKRSSRLQIGWSRNTQMKI